MLLVRQTPSRHRCLSASAAVGTKAATLAAIKNKLSSFVFIGCLLRVSIEFTDNDMRGSSSDAIFFQIVIICNEVRASEFCISRHFASFFLALENCPDILLNPWKTSSTVLSSSLSL